MNKHLQKLTGSSTSQKKNENPQNKSCQCSEEKLSIVSVVCRICYDDSKDEPIITPCRCKGTVAFIHRSCLEKWLGESNTTSCELCHYVYHTERTPRFTAKNSVWQWFRHQPQNLGFQVRGLRSDLFACALLTPLAIVITYVCLFSADYYNQQKFSNIPAARWTSISLLVMISIMLVGYYLWVYMVIRYHGRVWYYWWQRECIVRYIPPSSTDITRDVEAAQEENIRDIASHNTLEGENVEVYPDNTGNIEGPINEMIVGNVVPTVRESVSSHVIPDNENTNYSSTSQ